MTPWTAAYQAPPSMGLSRQEYWSGVPLPSPYLTIKNNIMPFSATWMNLEIIILSITKLGKEKYHMISLICGILKKGVNELIYTKEIDPKT